MSVNTKAACVPQLKGLAREREFSEATRFAQYTLLAEIPGLIFGVITVAYIASSLWAVA
jgi:hypothetical protein